MLKQITKLVLVLSLALAGWTGIAVTEAQAGVVSNDASLASVAGQTDASPGGGGGGSAVTAIAWTVSVASSVYEIRLADAVAGDSYANVELYSGSDFATGPVSGGSIALTAGGATTVYVKVTAPNMVTTNYYAVTINRAAIASEVTADSSAALLYYVNDPAVSVIHLVYGTDYRLESATVNRPLTINGHGATITAGLGLTDTVVRSDNVIVSDSVLTNYAGVQVFLKIEGAGSKLKLEHVTLKNGENKNGTDSSNDGIFSVINVKTGGSLETDGLTLAGFHNNPTPGNNLSFGIHAEPGAVSTVVRRSSFGSSNAFRNAIAIRSGALELTDNTFTGTDYPLRLRQSDGYEYAVYIYGGTGDIKRNTATGFNKTTFRGYSSGGISVIGFYPTNIVVADNLLSFNDSGIDITRTWQPYSTNLQMIVNGISLTSGETAYDMGQAVRLANQQIYVTVSLDQNDVTTVGSGSGYGTVMGGYRSPVLNATALSSTEVSFAFPTDSGTTDIMQAASTLELEWQKGDETSWMTATPTWLTTRATGKLALEPHQTYRIRARMTHFTSEPPPVTLVTYTNPLLIATVTADDVKNLIGGLDTTMEYSIDGGAYVKYDGANPPALSGAHTVKTRVAATLAEPAGLDMQLAFTANPVATGLTVASEDARGVVHNGKTKITATPAVTTSGHKLVYISFGSGQVVVPGVGELATGYADLPADGRIAAANGDKIGVAEVDAEGRFVAFGYTTAQVTRESDDSPQPSGTGVAGGTGGPAANADQDVIVLVNGKEESAGKAKTSESNGVKTMAIIVDPAKLQAKLDAEGSHAVVTIPVGSTADVIVGELTGQMVKSMENVSATLVLRTDRASYTLPANEINISDVAAKLDGNAPLADIKISVTIATPSSAMLQAAQQASAAGAFTAIAPPLEFTVTAAYGDRKVEVTQFSAYVERTVSLPDGIDPNKITTGVVVEPDGSVRHAPTTVTASGSRYFAKINSLTNSTYAVVWHPLTFADVESHWAKAAVNDMGSRMVVNGKTASQFAPDEAITRAEFAAIVVRGMGLRSDEGAPSFNDVTGDAWYAGAVRTAAAYGLIAGYEDGAFRPAAQITREEAATIIARAMRWTGLTAKLGAVSADAELAVFADTADTSAWAKDSVALAAKAELVSGREGGRLAPGASVTRAEVATLVQRLLQKSGLI